MIFFSILRGKVSTGMDRFVWAKGKVKPTPTGRFSMSNL